VAFFFAAAAAVNLHDKNPITLGFWFLIPSSHYLGKGHVYRLVSVVLAVTAALFYFLTDA
jgi:hypothetical protein